MNDTTKIDGVWYKKSKATNAFWFNNGRWCVSQKTNAYVFSLLKPLISPHNGARAKTGMVNALTYVEARRVFKQIEAGTTTAGKVARAHGIDIKTIHRALEMYEDKGPLGFSRYIGEVS